MDFIISCCMFDFFLYIKVVWLLIIFFVIRIEYFFWGRFGGYRKEGGIVILVDIGLFDRFFVKVKDFLGVILIVNISYLEDIKIVRYIYLGLYFFIFLLIKLDRVNIFFI